MNGVAVRVGSGETAASNGADAAAETGQRKRKRDSLFLSARLSLAGVPGVYDVRVRNLSEGGLMAELDRMVETGTAASLEMSGLGEMTGRVAWCAHGRMGIALDHPIDPSRARKRIGPSRSASGVPKPLVVPGRRG